MLSILVKPTCRHPSSRPRGRSPPPPARRRCPWGEDITDMTNLHYFLFHQKQVFQDGKVALLSVLSSVHVSSMGEEDLREKLKVFQKNYHGTLAEGAQT